MAGLVDAAANVDFEVAYEPGLLRALGIELKRILFGEFTLDWQSGASLPDSNLSNSLRKSIPAFPIAQIGIVSHLIFDLARRVVLRR